MYAIEVTKLTKRYGKARGIEDVSFTVEEGEIFGFIGPNGAGKSTVIRTLLSLIHPTSGKVRVFGKDCTKHAPYIAKHVGYLPSEVFYYEKMRVIDLLKYSASFYKKDCSKRIEELADILHLDLQKKISDLSFGNKKKVGIVQCLLHEPKLIILDEPTSGLDPLIQQKFFELLLEENRKGATIFLSSHVLSEVQRLCTRVGIIKDGKMIKIEKMSDLTENNYKKVRVEAAAAIPKSLFQLDGVSNLQIDGYKMSFLFKGNINVVMKRLAQLEMVNVWIEEPSLEEVFIHYYERESYE